jgi:hypothetical protein
MGRRGCANGCAILRRMAIEKQNSHTSTRKKASASQSTSRAKKAASKASKADQRLSAAKVKNKELQRRKKLEEQTLKMFQMVYDDYQQGKFHRIL